MKVGVVDAIESLKVSRVVEPDVCFDHILQGAAGFFQDGDDALNDVVSLRDDPARDHFAILAERHLAGHEHETVGDGRLAEGQVLAPGAGSRPTNTLDRQRSLLWHAPLERAMSAG